MTDFGKWIGGLMHSTTGAHDPIARNTMAANIVASTKEACACEKVDLIVIGVPAGEGDDFMEKIGEALGEKLEARGQVFV
jgi:hypothetical protein